MAWSGAAPAQEARDEGAGGAREEAQAESAGVYAPDATRAEKLDALFAALREAGPEEYEPIEKEIGRIWSRSGSDSMDLLLQRGRAAMQGKHLRRAIAHFSALVEHAPDFAEGWNARATAWYLKGEWGQSLADIEQVLRLEPRHYGALAGLGMILEQMGRKKDALKAFRAAAAVHPNLERVEAAIARLAPEVDGRDI